MQNGNAYFDIFISIERLVIVSLKISLRDFFVM
jgi:hypothetical protein